MRLALGADHAGWRRKAALAKYLRSLGHSVKDVGTSADDSVDYPDYARRVALEVKRRGGRGLLVCGTGIGMAIAANKVRGIRAAVAWSPETARLASEHNGANVLCLSGRLFGLPALKRMAKAWLATRFAGGRHRRRIRKIAAMERA